MSARWSQAQKLIRVVQTEAGIRYSVCQGHAPLNHGIRYATAASGQEKPFDAVRVIACNARSRFRYVAPQLSASIFSRSRPLEACCFHGAGKLTAAFKRPPCGYGLTAVT